MDSDQKSEHACEGGWVFPLKFLLLCFTVFLSPLLFSLIPLLPPFSWDESSFHPLLQRGPWCLFAQSLTIPDSSSTPFPNSSSRGPWAFITPTTFHIPHQLKATVPPLTSMQPRRTRKIYSGVISSSEKGPRALEGHTVSHSEEPWKTVTSASE